MPVNRTPGFRPAWWLRSPHLQTLWAAQSRRQRSAARQRERVVTPDDDFLDLDWRGEGTGPLVLLVHGLTGSSRSPYILGMEEALQRRGFRTVAFNFRGCSGSMNNTSRCYHSGETGDISFVYRHLRVREPGVPIGVVGFSLGGNVILKWLGEMGWNADLFAAAAVSVPLLLHLCATRMDQGFSRIYRDRLLRELKGYLARKRNHLHNIGRVTEAKRVEELGDLSAIQSFWDYDQRVVAGLYGFLDAEDYYRRSSSRQFLHAIRVPTLIVQAADDPFMTDGVIPEPSELSEAVHLDVAPAGGHVGFIAGVWPGRPRFWLEERIPDFLEASLRAGQQALC